MSDSVLIQTFRIYSQRSREEDQKKRTVDLVPSYSRKVPCKGNGSHPRTGSREQTCPREREEVDVLGLPTDVKKGL